MLEAYTTMRHDHSFRKCVCVCVWLGPRLHHEARSSLYEEGSDIATDREHE